MDGKDISSNSREEEILAGGYNVGLWSSVTSRMVTVKDKDP